MGKALKEYTVIYSQGPTSWGAYVPDLPIVVAVGDTLEGTRHSIREAIEFHIEGLRFDGEPIPEPSTVADRVQVAA
jgi:predicted RNase H-like HicB family nuclease